jgi:hypothetical protein
MAARIDEDSVVPYRARRHILIRKFTTMLGARYLLGLAIVLA